MGKGYDLYGSAMVSQRSMDFHTGITDPYFLGKPLATGIDIFHSSRKYNTKSQDSTGYRQMKTGGSLTSGYDVTEFLGQSWSYTIRRDFIDDIRKNASPYIKAQQGKWVVSILGHNLFYDKRNNSIDPTKGYYGGLSNDLAGAGGDVRFFKNALRGGIYVPLDEEHKWVFATRGSTGAMSGMGKTTRVVDRYELGGDSFRGFADAGIGPRDKRTKDALGGLFYYKGTVELYFPLGLPNELGIKGSIFSDMGSVWHSGNKSGHPDIILSNNQKFRASAGAQITWRSPFGPIGVSLANPFVRIKHVDRVEQFRVMYGTSF